MTVRAFLGLGANLGRPAAAIHEAIGRIERLEGTRLVAVARLYGSRPVGPSDQPDYVNTAVEIETSLAPHALLAAAKSIERELGRAASVRWGPRAIDVDVLLYGDERIASGTLTVPHAELANRRFVLAPLADLAPDRIVPGIGASVSALLAALGDDPAGVWPLAPEGAP